MSAPRLLRDDPPPRNCSAMLSRSSRRLVVPLLLAAAGLSLASLTSCKSSLPQMGEQMSVGTRIRVDKAYKSKKDQRVSVVARIWNDHDLPISFGLGDVGLEVLGRRSTPNPEETKIREPYVQQGSYRDFTWTFDLGAPVAPGEYAVTIINVQKGGVPLGESISFKIKL